jgi:hypothetical protein
MRVGIGTFAAAAAFLALLASSDAEATDTSNQCSVVAGEKLAATSAGAALLCSEVERAIASAAPGASYRVQIKVLSPSRLVAILVVNGRTLPEQHFAITDRELNRGAIERFAHLLGLEVAKAAKP